MKGGPINSARILYFTFHVFLYFCKDFKQLKVFFSSSNFWKRKYLQEKKNSEEAFQLKKLLRQFQKKIRKVKLGELTFDRLFPPKFFFNFQKSFSVSLSLSSIFLVSFLKPLLSQKIGENLFPILLLLHDCCHLWQDNYNTFFSQSNLTKRTGKAGYYKKAKGFEPLTSQS